MNKLLIGNILCFIGSVIMTLMGLIKNKKKFITAQCGMNLFFIAGNSFLGGISGAIANFVTLTRNVVLLKWNMNTALKIVFISLQIILTSLSGSHGILMWFPVLGVCLFTWFIDSENMILLKYVVIISQLLWAVYDFSIKNYATVPFDISAVITNTISIIGLYKIKKENALEAKKSGSE